jgi:hypothetical protein
MSLSLEDNYIEQGWKPASVGCHWSRGSHFISTYQIGSESGYVLVLDFVELGRFKSFDDASHAADRRVNPC